MTQFGKRDELIVHEQEPFNAETDRGSLLSSVTATNAFYVRSHGPVPKLDSDAWRLCVDGLVERKLSLSLETLQEAFVERTLTATLQCAGNRRAGLIAVRDIPGEAPWGPGATGTATWTGIALADVLALAGPLDGATHVGFEGADMSAEAEPAQLFGGSIPLDKASRTEVLLAWAMNGQPLAAVHGAPVRVVVPGYIGARSVKWLTRIELRSEPWSGYFQHVVYRLLAPDQTAGPGIGMPLGLVALNSDVLVPHDGAEVPAGKVEVRGYAFAGGDRHVARVDVSIDNGRSWSEAQLLDDLGRWAWRHWSITLELSPGQHEILVRAWDSSAATPTRERSRAVESQGIRQQRASSHHRAIGRQLTSVPRYRRHTGSPVGRQRGRPPSANPRYCRFIAHAATTSVLLLESVPDQQQHSRWRFTRLGGAGSFVERRL